MRAIAGLVPVLASATALAQSATTQVSGDSQGAATTTLEEVVVTAQKREERLQDVPIAISVLSGDAFEKSSDRGVIEAVSRVPGVLAGVSTAGSRGGGNPMIAIRGVSSPTTGASTVGYYVDSVPYGRNGSAIVPDTSPYDLDRVEVLRGPQGTLYGATALNGVVRVLTRKPNLQEFEFKARGRAQDTERGSESYAGDAAFNVPLIQDKLAARIVLGYQDQGGWIDKPNLASGPREDANDSEKKTGRIKLAAKPSDDLSIGLSGWFQRSDSGAPPTSNDGGRTNISPFDEPNSMDFDTYNLDVAYDTSLFSIKSSTSYMDLLQKAIFDATAFRVGTIITRSNSKIFTEELVLSSLGEGPWRWTAGAMYRDGKDNNSETRATYIATGLPGSITHAQSRSIAVFGEVTREFADGRYELTGGLRYFKDKLHDWEDVRLGVGIPPGGLQTIESTFEKVTPRVILNWHPHANSTFYASYTQGFRSGINQRFNVIEAIPGLPPATPDTLTNYELGAKQTLLEGRLSLESAFYYIDWKNPQQNRTVSISSSPTPVPIFESSGSVSGAGVDLAVTYSPITALTMGFSVGWNDLTYDSDVYSLNNAGANILVSPKGSRRASSPETTSGAFVDYAIPLGSSGYRGRMSASVNHITKQIASIDSSGVRSTQGIVFIGDALTMTRANFTLEAPKRWSAMLFVDNIGDEKGLLRDNFSPQYNTVIRPRTYGVQFDYRY